MSNEKETPKLPGAEAQRWLMSDPVLALRPWGAARPRDFEPTKAVMLAGKLEECGVFRFDDESISRQHAILRQHDGVWTITEHPACKNGIFIDGERRKSATLSPGMVIKLGALRLLVESSRIRALRTVLQRYIGWSDAATDTATAEALDGAASEAVVAVRDMVALRNFLVLRGDGGLGLARRLHAMTIGPSFPFVVAGPKDDGRALVAKAANGTMYLQTDALPSHWGALADELYSRASEVRAVVAAPSEKQDAKLARLRDLKTITIPPLRTRSAAELHRILTESVADAVAEFGVTSAKLTAEDWAILQARSQDPSDPWEDHDEIDFWTRRLVAGRTKGATAGGKLVGLTKGGLSLWFSGKGFPGLRE